MADPGFRGIQEVKYGKSGQTLTYWLEVDGLQVSVTSATITIYKPGQGSPEATPIVATTAMTASGTTVMSYALDASDTGVFPLGESYRAELAITVSSTVYYREIIFDVVRTPIIHACPIRVDDLYRVHVDISQAVAQQSLASTIHQSCIIPAWQECLHYVESCGKRPALISPPETLYQMVWNKAAQLLCEFLSRGPDDLWARMASDPVTGRGFLQKYENAKRATILRYSDGDQFDHDKRAGFQQITVLTGRDPDTIYGGVPPLRRQRARWR